MIVDRKITWGNIVSWVMIVIGLTTGWVKIESATAQNTKDVAAAVLLAQKVEDNQRTMDSKRDAQINSLTVDVAVMKNTMTSVDKKIDELIRRKE
jgi:hypothetical protein